MSEFLDTATNRVDAQKAALLKAVAEQGTAGRTAFKQAGKVTNDLRQQAFKQLAVPGGGNLSDGQPFGSGYLDTPGNENGALGTIQASIAQSRALQDADTARQAASGEEYFSKLQGALPFVDQETQRTIQEIAAQRAEAEADREFKRQQQASAGRSMSLSERKYNSEQDLAAKQDQFRAEMAGRVGPTTQRAFNAVIGGAKDLNQALGNIATTSLSAWKANLGIDDPRTIASLEELVRAYFTGQPVPASFQHNAPKESDKYIPAGPIPPGK